MRSFTSASVQAAISSLRDANVLRAAFASLRGALTVVTAVMTWVTIWHFSATPFPLFYGWTFSLISHTVFSAIAVARSPPTTRIVQQLWRWGSSSGAPADDALQLNAPAVSMSSKRQSPGSRLQSKRADAQSPVHCSYGLQPELHSSSCAWCAYIARLLRLSAAIVALLLLFLSCLIVHGGAVLADLHLARCYLAMRSVPNTPAKQAVWQRLKQAQQDVTESCVILALLFTATAVGIKWALIMYFGDFSWVPVLSLVLSTISYTAALSAFVGTTFMCGPGWTARQRAAGVAAVVAVVLGQFLWRLAARSWLVFKLGGEAYMVWMYAGHVTIAISVFARPEESRRAYREAYEQSRVSVLFLTMMGSAFLSYDFPTFFHALKSKQVARRPDWLKRLMLSFTALRVLAWRVTEGIVAYVLILAFHPVQPCNRQLAPAVGWYHVCKTAVEQEFYVWRPKCWGCSMFDAYYVLGPVQEQRMIVAVMLATAAALLLMTACGLLVISRLLSNVCHPVPAAMVGGNASQASAPVPAAASRESADSQNSCAEAETAGQYPCYESAYDYASGVVDSSVSQPLASSGAAATAHIGVFGHVCMPMSGVPLAVCSHTSWSGPLLPYHSDSSASDAMKSCSVAQALHVEALPKVTVQSSIGNAAVEDNGQSELGLHNGVALMYITPYACMGLSSGVDGVHVARYSSSVIGMENSLGDATICTDHMCTISKNSSVVSSTSSIVMQNISNPSAHKISVNPGSDAPSRSNAGMPLVLQIVVMAAIVAVGDIVLFNCHWLLQSCLLVTNISYCVWLHIQFLITHYNKPA